MKTIKSERLTKYLNSNYSTLYAAQVSEVLFMALKDLVDELIVTKEEYETITKYMVMCGVWNWDREKFMGMKFVVV